jgi:hypothetical protein
VELAEASDVPVRWSCRTGVCHSCESGLVSGAVVYGPEPFEKPADGNLLVCCSQPVRNLVIDLRSLTAIRFLTCTRSFTVARVRSLKDGHGRLPAAAGRKWRIRAPPHIRPKPKRGATNATGIAVMKLASTTSERRLAIRRVCADTCVASAPAST